MIDNGKLRRVDSLAQSPDGTAVTTNSKTSGGKMDYKVASVVKRVTLLIMTMALAVAMVACTGATSVKGEQGAQGPTGEAGPAGPPGTLDNEPPMVTKALDMVYLALAGSGKMDVKTITLSNHFMDKENAALVFKAATSDDTVATAKTDGAKLTVTGKGAGTATITVSAYDGVTPDATTSSFDVMVVASNASPYVQLTTGVDLTTDPPNLGTLTSTAVTAESPGGEQQQLRAKLFMTNVRGKTTIGATIHAGDDPFDDEVSFSYAMGADGKDDDIVDVEITPKSGAVNMWEVKLTPLKPGMQNVYVIVKDKFGATAETPEDAAPVSGTTDDTTVVAQRFQFVAFVNTVPELVKPLPDKTIVGTAGSDTATYTIAEFFNTDEDPVTAGPKIDSMEKPATGPGVAAAAGALAGGAIGTADPEDQRANDAVCTATSSKPTVASVATTATMVTVGGTDGTVGKTIITITCRDNEGSATGTATVTVRADRS